MKVHVKTLSKKSLFIDIEDTKSVLELKKELSLYPDVGVDAELQRLIYAGKILANEDPLAMYNIDTSKFLVVMTLKKPDAALEAAPSAKEEAKVEETKPEVNTPPAASETKDVPVIPAEKSDNEKMVDSIVSMGYPESEVRQALAASFYNPERAIEYLIEGIPSSTAPDVDEVMDVGDFDLTEENEEASLQDLFNRGGDLQQLRQHIQRNPDMLNQLIQQIGDSNPNFLNLMNENPQEFLAALLYNSDEEDDDDDDDDDPSEDV